MERRVSERQEKTWAGGEGMLLIVVMDFHKHVHMPKHKVVQLYLNKTVFSKRNIRGLTLFPLENELDCVSLLNQPLLPNM